jgi:hypothetical protein
MRCGLFAIDAEPQPDLLAGRNRRNPHGAARTIVEAQEDMRVVLEPPTRYHGLQVGGQRRRASAGDEFAQVEAMRAEIADDEGGASLRQAACLLSPSPGPDSQPSANSTCKTRTAPSAPASISVRASRTIG